MNLGEIETLFEKINECIDFYEKTYIKNKVFTIYLGNGEQVKYMITPDNLPHLLGINLDFIRTTYNYSNITAYDLMLELLENPYKLYKLFNGGVIKQEQVFSKNINQKIEGFKDNFKYDAKEVLEDTDFVCTFKSENSWEITDKNQKYDYVMVKTLPNGKIALLCLVRKGFQCYAMSNQLFDSIEEATETFKVLLANQQVTLLTGFKVYNKVNDTNFNWTLTMNQKHEKIEVIKNYRDNFECNVNITSDYEYTIQKMLENKHEKRENYYTSEEIVDCIANKQIIDREKYEDSTLLAIIDAWNDHICQSSSNNGEENPTYTETIIELKAIKKVALELEEENKKLETKVTDLETKNQDLIDENINHIKDKEAIMKILKPEN